MIPLIDITLVLLIFFMMTAAVNAGLFSPIDTPPASERPASPPRPRMEPPVRRAEAPPVKHDPPFVMQIISGSSKHEVAFSGPNAEVKNNREVKNNSEAK